MKRLSLLVVLLLCAGCYSADARQQTSTVTIIVGATVIDGTGAEPRPANVIVRGDRIEAIGPDLKPPTGARIINADGQTLIPGLFDLHTHLPYASAGGGGDWPKNLKSYLYCGVTSVVDFGTYPETFEPMRRLIKNGVVAAPRISLAARMSTPGGHGAEGGRGDFFSLEVSTAREARAAVRRVLPYQPDVIKVFTDGWRYGASPDMSSMNQETLSALVDEAHKNGIEVLTHTVTLEKTKIAARAGVDVVAHAIGNAEADQEVLELMKTKGTSYAPTLAVYEPRGRDILSPLLATVLDPVARAAINPPLVPPGPERLPPGPGSVENGDPARRRRWSIISKNTALLRAGGVNIATGTDAGVTGTHHGWATLRELQLLVATGLTPLEAITAATGHAARAIKVDHERGTLAPGKLADLVLIAGAPHKNISDIEKIRRVFLGGRELDRDAFARDIASAGMSPIPAVKARELIDDFEGADGRSRLDTLWVNTTDSGVDASRMVFGRVLREPGNHAMSASVRMSDKERPFGRLNVPLTRGAIEPMDVREFKAIRFEVRGDGEYRLLAPTYNLRSGAPFQSPFKATPQWQTITIEFSALKQESARTPMSWRGDDLLMFSFEIARPTGAIGWLEIDNLRFSR